MFNHSKLTKPILALAVSSVFLFGCSEQAAEQPAAAPPAEKAATPAPTATAASQVAAASSVNPQAGVTRVAAAINPPFVTRDKQGQADGFDVEIMKAIAETEGLHVEFMPRVWDGALATLENDESDVVIAAVTLNPERAEKYLASNTYVSTPNSLVVLADSPIKSTDDLKGKIVGVEAGSSILRDKDKYPTTEFREFKTSYLAVNEMMSKTIDAVASQKLHAQYLLKDDKTGVRFVDLPSAYPDKVIMVKKGNTELVGKINSGLEKIKANGTYDKIYAKWFGTAAK